MKIFDSYYVCRTGKLGQFFTLYITRTFTTETFHSESCYFVQNLSHDRDEAIDKAESLMAERKALMDGRCDYKAFLDFSDSKKKEYCDLKAFGINWKKTRKGFVVFLNNLPQSKCEDIWETWRADKDLLKEAGFSIFKCDDEWALFFRNCPQEEMVEKLSTLKLKKAVKVVKGNFIGEVKDKVDVEATLTKYTVKDGMFGRVQIMTFDVDGNSVVSFYQGKFLAPEVGSKVALKGTVTKHSEFNGVNQTTLNRISFK